MLAAILVYISSGSRCKKLLAGDGITTADFTITGAPGLFEGVAVDARSAKKNAPALGDTFGIAKNLDEYQYRICSLVPALVDSPLKVRLQKYRIAIIAAFAALGPVVKHDWAAADGWNAHARTLLVEASDLYVAATRPGPEQPLPASKIAQACSFFGVPEEKVDGALAAMYGIDGAQGPS